MIYEWQASPLAYEAADFRQGRRKIYLGAGPVGVKRAQNN